MNFIMKVPYVIKRKNIHYFKFNIPADCRPFLKGRSEVKQSLKTTDILSAKAKSEKLAQIWKERISKIHEANASAEAPAFAAEIKLEAIADKFREQVAPDIEKQMHAYLAMPDDKMRQTLYMSIDTSIDAYKPSEDVRQRETD